MWRQWDGVIWHCLWESHPATVICLYSGWEVVKVELHSTLIILNPHVASISKTDRKYIIFTSFKLFFSYFLAFLVCGAQTQWRSTLKYIFTEHWERNYRYTFSSLMLQTNLQSRMQPLCPPLPSSKSQNTLYYANPFKKLQFMWIDSKGERQAERLLCVRRQHLSCQIARDIGTAVLPALNKKKREVHKVACISLDLAHSKPAHFRKCLNSWSSALKCY